MDGPLVLLADDEAHITCVVAERLRAAGFSVATARDGEEALEMALRLRPTLVITDLQMPRMNGLDLALKLAASDSGAATPVVMLTARGYILDQATLAKTNVRTVMGKPFSVREVVKVAAELVGGLPAQRRPEAA
jgi:two-component system phosphate regulon response regulator PhoB